MKQLLKNIVFFFIILIVFIGINEFFFRTFRGAPNPLADTTQKENRYLFEPNQTKHNKSSVDGEFEYSARINQFGYRGKDFSANKDRNQVRIFAIGDSFTYGVGAEDHETIPVVLEQKLKNKHPYVEVVNAGIGHASPVRHYVNLRDIHLQYQPDIVVVLLDLTDLWDDWHSERNAIYDKNGEIVRFDPLYINGKRDWWITAVNYSAFAKYLNRKAVRTLRKIQALGFDGYVKAKKEGKRAKAVIINSDDVDEAIQLEYDGLLMMRGRSKEDFIRKNWQRSANYLSKMKAMLDERNIPMVLVMYPHGIYVSKDEWAGGREPWGFEMNKQYTDYLPFEIVEEYAREHNIPFINTLDNFLTAPPQKYFFDYDGHMTPAGYKIVGESVADHSTFQETLQSVLN